MIATFEFDQNLVGETLNVNFLDISEPDGDYESAATNFDTSTVVVNQENQAEIDFTNKENFSHIQFLLESNDELVRTSKYIPVEDLQSEFDGSNPVSFDDSNSSILFRYSSLYPYGGELQGSIVPEMQLANVDFDEVDLSGIEFKIVVYERVYDENDPTWETYTDTTLKEEIIVTDSTGGFETSFTSGGFDSSFIGEEFKCSIEVLSPGALIRKQTSLNIGEYMH